MLVASLRTVSHISGEGSIKTYESLLNIDAAVWTPYKIVFGGSLKEEKKKVRNELSGLRIVNLDWLTTR